MIFGRGWQVRLEDVIDLLRAVFAEVLNTERHTDRPEEAERSGGVGAVAAPGESASGGA